jgi:hypothetical protein
MDESGNNDGNALLVVGALATGYEFAQLEERVLDAYEEFAARRDLRGMASFEHFRRVGFHAAEDPREIQQAFIDEIGRWLGFKTFVVTTDRSRFAGRDETERLLVLYRILLRDVLLRFRHYGRVNLLVEENEQLRRHLRSLTEQLPGVVRQKAPRAPVPEITATMVSKRNPHLLSVLDYVMAACVRWMKDGQPRDPQRWTFRQFLAVQPSISMLYSLEHGLISNRRHRIS